MAQKVLLLHLSPRETGNCHTLAETFTAGAEAAGHAVNRLNIGTANICPCQACDYCRNHDHQCLIEDDMSEIYPLLSSYDVIVFAAPLYFYGLPAQMKALVDRLYALGPEYLQKATALLMTAADSSADVFASAIGNFKQAFIEYLGWKNKGILVVPGVYAIGDIKDNPLLLKAYQMGFKL